MKVVVVSDSHRWNGLNDIVASTNADYYLHAGDSGLPAELIDPFIAVRGNCDLYTYPLERIIDVGFAKIYLHHGHYYSRSQMILKAKAHDCQIIVLGTRISPHLMKLTASIFSILGA
jgi:predicted phosphodiesterase